MMGTPRFLVLYLASGIFGNILGGNFALVGLPSAGASGAIFGTQAAFLVCVHALVLLLHSQQIHDAYGPSTSPNK